jgi:hypothetical protein
MLQHLDIASVVELLHASPLQRPAVFDHSDHTIANVVAVAPRTRLPPTIG